MGWEFIALEWYLALAMVVLQLHLHPLDPRLQQNPKILQQPTLIYQFYRRIGFLLLFPQQTKDKPKFCFRRLLLIKMIYF
jgi:hypothetical protein